MRLSKPEGKLGVVEIRKHLVKVKSKNGISYYPDYRILLPKEFIETYGLKEGDLVHLLPLRQFDSKTNKEEDLYEGHLKLLREKLGLSLAEAKIYLTLARLGGATEKELSEKIGLVGGYLKEKLLEMTKRGFLSRKKEKRAPHEWRSYVYRAVDPSKFLGIEVEPKESKPLLEDNKVEDLSKVEPNAQISHHELQVQNRQVNDIQGYKVIRETIAKSWRLEKGGKVYEGARISPVLPKSYVGKKILIVTPKEE